MRIGKVIGTVTLSRKLSSLPAGHLKLVYVLDEAALASRAHAARRESPMPEAMVVYDALGAGVGEVIAFTEGGEATAPFYPDRVPVDAYAAAILDNIEFERDVA